MDHGHAKPLVDPKHSQWHTKNSAPLPAWMNHTLHQCISSELLIMQQTACTNICDDVMPLDNSSTRLLKGIIATK